MCIGIQLIGIYVFPLSSTMVDYLDAKIKESIVKEFDSSFLEESRGAANLLILLCELYFLWVIFSYAWTTECISANSYFYYIKYWFELGKYLLLKFVQVIAILLQDTLSVGYTNWILSASLLIRWSNIQSTIDFGNLDEPYRVHQCFFSDYGLKRVSHYKITNCIAVSWYSLVCEIWS